MQEQVGLGECFASRFGNSHGALKILGLRSAEYPPEFCVCVCLSVCVCVHTLACMCVHVHVCVWRLGVVSQWIPSSWSFIEKTVVKQSMMLCVENFAQKRS